MNLSKNFTFNTIAAAVLAAGISFPLYAADTTEAAAPAPQGSVTTVLTAKTTTHVAKHKVHHGAVKVAKKTETKEASADPERATMMKNGIVLHDVEPTEQSQTSPFGIPTSTSDTLKGGVTSTVVPASQ